MQDNVEGILNMNKSTYCDLCMGGVRSISVDRLDQASSAFPAVSGCLQCVQTQT